MAHTKDDELWEWQAEECNLQKDSQNDLSRCIWDEVSQNEDLSYIFDEKTPIKACGDLAYNFTDIEDSINNKETEQCGESSSQLKRRRMLKFKNHVPDSSFCSEMESESIKSKDRLDLIEGALPETSQWISGFSEDRYAYGNDGMDRSSEGWLLNCFNDAEMHFSTDDMNLIGVSEDQVDISELCNITTETEADMMQVCATSNPQSVFKGKKSYIQTHTKMASSVAYPFAFIKPCGVHGDVTLKDINQRIHTPPSSKLKPDEDEFSASYPTSAFSGKPVVVKTKIRTEGGKGSITIMRTKG